MSAFAELLGDKLVSGSGEVRTQDALAGKGAVALYFSAHWCPPCRGFTPTFAEWYSQNLKAKGLEVVFVSSDHSEDDFQGYFKEMPWLALPFSEREKKEALSSKFKIKGIPSVIILDAEGALITKDGREAISQDPQGHDLPWKPKTLAELLNGATLIGEGGKKLGTNEVEGKVLGLYFSAHWCPPCRGFTPKLAEWYTNGLKAKGLEVVFISSDKDESSFAEYFKEMPWLALDFADRKRKSQLSSKYGVSGIPSLVIVGADGSTITTEGRGALSADPEGADFPWYPKPVKALSSGPGLLQEVPTILAFCETNDGAEQKAAEAAMAQVAELYLAEQKAAGQDEPRYNFMIATEAGGLAGHLRTLFSLPTLPPGKHAHPLEVADSKGGWGCDGCGCSGTPEIVRYRCTQNCDFDFCGDCHANAGAVQPHPPKLVLVDIPDEGGYYEGPEGEITHEAVAKLVADYEAKRLERKQMNT